MWPQMNRAGTPYFAYVACDSLQRRHVKFGYSRDPEQRLAHEDWRIYGRKSAEFPRSVYLRTYWQFHSAAFALCVEQTSISMAQRLGYRRIDENDWYDMDEDGIQFVETALAPIVEGLRKIESHALLSSPAKREDKPYGAEWAAWLAQLRGKD